MWLPQRKSISTAEDLDAFSAWIAAQQPAKLAALQLVNGDLDYTVLDMVRESNSSSAHIEAHHHEHASQEPQFELAPGRLLYVVKIVGKGITVVVGYLVQNTISSSMIFFAFYRPNSRTC